MRDRYHKKAHEKDYSTLQKTNKQKTQKTVNITKEDIPHKDREVEKLPTKNLLLHNNEGLLMPPEGKLSPEKPAQW